ncbi:MAG: OmpA family protein [Bacteroidia bacterium]|nr:OmpA family protein [Bacteroidia bacterium]
MTSNPTLLRKASSERTLIFTLLSAIAVVISSCGGPKMDEALKLYRQGYYGQAAYVFEAVSKKAKNKEDKQKAIFYAAESYRLNNDYEKAKRLYEKTLRTDPKNTRALLMHANMLKKQEKYREAMDAYDKYLQEVPGDTLAMNKKKGCEYALRWTPDSSRYVVENFKPANTKSNDWAPMIASKKDNLLFFASDREGGKGKKVYAGTMEMWSDIWYIEKTGKKNKEKWGKPVFLEKGSTKFNEGGQTFDSRFSTMYLTQCGGTDGKAEKCAIYEYKKMGPDWVMGDPLEFCKTDTGHSYGHPALSQDGTKLYFASDRPGGYGGYDIYVVNYSKRSKSWGDPVNLGPNINTGGNEYFPYLNQHDGKLYFSSDGLPGIGGLDIFMAKPTADVAVWSEVENLKEPLNSGGDDFGITFLENKDYEGFFTSNRGDRKNNDDIYSFTIKPLVITITGIVTDCNTKKPLVGATVIMTNDQDTVKQIAKTDALGSYRFTLKPETRYELQAKFPEEYYFESDPVSRNTLGIKFSTELVQDFCLENPLDKIIVLPIFYDLDKAYIRPDAAKVLDTFARNVLLRYPKLVAELGSHTDCRATKEYNEDLARRRADSAVNYLVKVHKIDPKRIEAKGYGETQLINDCKCEGSEIEGFTEYIEGVTRKAVVLKDEAGNVIRSYYENYKPGEIQTVKGKKVVPCDEYQHQQNRRTTVRFSRDGLSSRVKVDEKQDPNNTNNGKTGTTPTPTPGAPGTPAPGETKPRVDDPNAIKVRIFKNGTTDMVAAMVGESESTQFAFDLLGKYTAVTPEVAAEWYKNKLINKGSFLEGEKVKVGDVKLPSNKFIIDKMSIGGASVENITFTVTDKVEKPTLGKTFFKSFKPESYKTDTELVLIPKKAPKKEKEEKPKE